MTEENKEPKTNAPKSEMDMINGLKQNAPVPEEIDDPENRVYSPGYIHKYHLKTKKFGENYCLECQTFVTASIKPPVF